ncbi:uncharacterized protein LOC111681259 [Lucilia cuprina]|uniref:uncharacterized protein LOC111681259 n=1 Tax=Lucilia cuprina TaxID=7375 RepID=UPI001F058FBB|nr:uncharacterized protein LOC111681259 [Lucilia cuprina]
MGDLFDQLKSEGPLKKTSNTSSPAKTAATPTKSKYDKTVEDFNEKHLSKTGSFRRESLPSPLTVSSVLKKSKSQKARSLSPPKYGANNVIKSLKVKLERKKLEEFLTRPLEEHANNIRIKQEKIKDSHKHLKLTPTKAQQKLFEPLSQVGQKLTKKQMLKEFNIKPCKVRIHRDNLKRLAKEFKKKAAARKDNKIKAEKRTASDGYSGSPPPKKLKGNNMDAKHNKIKNNFFIKLNTSPSIKTEKKFKHFSRNSSSSSTSSSSSSSSVAQHNKIKNSKFNTITTPTKFSRSHLITSFGKRFFNVQVKIERCTHPLMLTFESNDRARRLQAKRNNKSKNLSVSFREQVEIFGGSSDSDDSCDEDFCAVPNRSNRKNNSSHSIPLPVTPVVMPARLKKVENGKVVDDIELDPSLFVDPKILVASTPFSPGRKKRDHKSFSPLKDESSPSPRKEQLKLANERIPPSGLRRLNIDEEDDEDDDCEYIVPIEMPQRRASRTSSNDDLAGLFDDDVNTNDNIDFTTNIANNFDKQSTPAVPSLAAVLNLENGSDDSFQSAKDMAEPNNATNNVADNQLSTLQLSSALNFGSDTNKDNNNDFGQLQQTTNGNESSKHMNTINTMDDISMNLFLEDSQTNEDDTHAKSFVDSLINETIDKLSKDIDEAGTD